MPKQVGGIVAGWTNEGEARLARVSEGPSGLKSLGGGENLEVGIIREIPRKSNTTTLASHYIVIHLAAYQPHHRI